MQLNNTFTVAAPLDEAWEAFNSPETVAPCFPGATLLSSTGDAFTGEVKVKLGPIAMSYKGKGAFVKRDKETRTIVIEASGRDSRGNGTAAATVTGTMNALGPQETEVTMVSDLKITGRPAQFGRGAISDVADKLIGQFSAHLADALRQARDPQSAATAQPAAVPDAINLLDAADRSLVKIAVPAIAAALLSVIGLIVVARRRRSE